MMSRRIGWVMFVAGVVFFGGVMNSQQKILVGPSNSQAAQAEESQDQEPKQGAEPQVQHAQGDSEESEAIVQLKEINSQLKELKALLRSGDVRVIVVMNPPDA
jgi:hypothetical protein